MKLLRILLAGLLILTGTIFSVAPANAGQLTGAEITISWDDSSLFEPPSVASGNCTSYSFKYTMTTRVLFADIIIKNRFNDKIGSTILSGVTTPGSGEKSVQLCPGKDLSGSKVVLEVVGRTGTSNEILSTPITFLSRTATPEAKPSPTPTKTVTATPSPTPTVYVTNPADANLKGEMLLLRGQIIALNLKLKKICSAKPKPKGC
jgi:hypothetical protein